MNSRTIALLSVVVPFGIMMALAGGCASKKADAPPTAQVNAANVQAIEQNPNIPPEAKAALQQTVQGKNVGGPNGPAK